jgi:dihydrofolate reductase
MQGYTASITIVAALDRNRAIGKNNRLPWERLRSDMKHFSQLTQHKDVVMGRKTYESLPDKYRPLPERRNWIVSSTANPKAFPGNCFIVRNPLELLLKAGGREVFVMGGELIYRAFLPYASRMILTHVEAEIAGTDVFFPPFPAIGWEESFLSRHEADAENEYAFSIVEYRKVVHAEEVQSARPASSW